MSPIVLAALTAVSGGFAMLLWLVLSGPAGGRRRVLANLNRDVKEASALPVSAASEHPESEMAAALRRRSPPVLLKNLTRLWAFAGRPEKWRVDRLLSTKAILGLAGLFALLALVLGMRDLRGLLFGAAAAAFLFFLPEILLYNNGSKRKTAIGFQLPDTLDQMSIAVNAGLGFDAAMSRVARNGKGELANELVRTLQDVQVGMSRRDAYTDLAERTNVPKLERFVRSILQGEAYGIALSDILQNQADELRMERRQDAERRAMQIPVKVVFPLILFIMPAMFIVVIGPGILQIINAFAGM